MGKEGDLSDFEHGEGWLVFHFIPSDNFAEKGHCVVFFNKTVFSNI